MLYLFIDQLCTVVKLTEWVHIQPVQQLCRKNIVSCKALI